LEQIVNLVRKFRYLDAIHQSDILDENTLDAKNIVLLSEVLFTASINLRGHPNETIKGYERIIRLINKLNKSKLKKVGLIRKLVYSLLFKGFELQELHKNRSAISCYNEIIKKFADYPDETVKSCVADALQHKADLLIQMKKIDQGIEIFQQIIAKYGSEKNKLTRETIAISLVKLGDIYADQGIENRSTESYDMVVRKYKRAISNSFLNEMVITALYQKGNTLIKFDRKNEAVTAYSLALEKIEKNNNPNFYDRHLKIVIPLGMMLSETDRDEEAIKLFDSYIQRFGNIKKSDIRSLMVDMLILRGVFLMKVNKCKEARKAFNEIIKKFSQSKNPEIRKNVDVAKQKIDLLKSCPYM